MTVASSLDGSAVSPGRASEFPIRCRPDAISLRGSLFNNVTSLVVL